jgi:hypothetical protein
MKKIAVVFVLACLIFATVGCTSTVPYFYSDNSAKDFDILGEVTYVGQLTKILWFPPTGSSTFQALLNEAKRKYSADYVVNVTIDYEKNWFFVFSTYTYTMRGTAIRYR